MQSSLNQVPTVAYRVWVLEYKVLRTDPGMGLLLSVRKYPEGMGVRSSATRNVHRGGFDYQRNKPSLFSDVQWPGTSF